MDKSEIKACIAKRVAKELHDGDVVNLGIGIPTMLATRMSFILTTVWWLVFTIPMLRHVHQKHAVEPDGSMIAQTFGSMKHTLSKIVGNSRLAEKL